MAVMCPGVRDVGLLARPGGRDMSAVVVVMCPGVRDGDVLAWCERGVIVVMMCPGVRDVGVLAWPGGRDVMWT